MSLSTKWLPTNPAPPVTSTLRDFLLIPWGILLLWVCVNAKPFSAPVSSVVVLIKPGKRVGVCLIVRSNGFESSEQQRKKNQSPKWRIIIGYFGTLHFFQRGRTGDEVCGCDKHSYEYEDEPLLLKNVVDWTERCRFLGNSC